MFLINKFLEKKKSISPRMVPLENVDDDRHHLSSIDIERAVNELDSFTTHISYSLLNNHSDQ